MSNPDKLIGLEVRARREIAGLTRMQVSEMLGFSSQVSVSRIEIGVRPVRLTEAIAIAEIVGCTVGDLTNPVADLVLEPIRYSAAEAKAIRIANLEAALASLKAGEQP